MDMGKAQQEYILPDGYNEWGEEIKSQRIVTTKMHHVKGHGNRQVALAA